MDTEALFGPLEREPHAIAPGVAHLPGWLPGGQQAEMVQQLRDIARSVAGTAVAMHQPVLPSGGKMSVHMLHLGKYWDYGRTAGFGYQDRVSGVAVPPVPGNLAKLAVEALDQAAQLAPELQPWSSTGAQPFEPQMALVNFYADAAQMGMHQDAYEASSAPVVSLSIGDEALFRIGGIHNRNKPWDEVRLCSGDVIVFGGPKRQAFHGVPKVFAGTGSAESGLTNGRINITFRQVSPHART